VTSHIIQTLPSSAAAYPRALFDLDVRPDPLYAIGRLDALQMPLVSMVGTRDATAYGLRSTRSIASAFARNGVAIVSGLARGIDAAAHRAALECDGQTIAVLGTGVDVPYPVGHAELHRAISERGLVLSESGAGIRAYKGAFPKRNRIIAALAEVTIVVEAGHKSGAQITARQVLDLGRTLACVPGPIDSPQSSGTNQLLRDGAHVIATVEDALTLAGVKTVKQAQPIGLGDNDARVWSALGGEMLSIDAIALRSKLSTQECLVSVTALELGGLVESLITGEIRRR
jgi:DNA processing protein